MQPLCLLLMSVPGFELAQDIALCFCESSLWITQKSVGVIADLTRLEAAFSTENSVFPRLVQLCVCCAKCGFARSFMFWNVTGVTINNIFFIKLRYIVIRKYLDVY